MCQQRRLLNVGRDLLILRHPHKQLMQILMTHDFLYQGDWLVRLESINEELRL